MYVDVDPQNEDNVGYIRSVRFVQKSYINTGKDNTCGSIEDEMVIESNVELRCNAPEFFSEVR